jgi:hypothetical protein
MARHLIIAHKREDGLWALLDIGDECRAVGEEKPYIYKTRKEAYSAAAQMWSANSTWCGRKERKGYSIEVD